jgi:hypothetical protein
MCNKTLKEGIRKIEIQTNLGKNAEIRNSQIIPIHEKVSNSNLRLAMCNKILEEEEIRKLETRNSKSDNPVKTVKTGNRKNRNQTFQVAMCNKILSRLQRLTWPSRALFCCIEIGAIGALGTH